MVQYNSDKREFKRFDVKLEVQYTRLAPHPDTSSGSLTYDISCGGLRLKCGEFIPLNAKLEVEIKIGTVSVITSLASVKWIVKEPCNEQYKAGLEFENMPEVNRNRIAQYLDYKDSTCANPRAYSVYPT